MSGGVTHQAYWSCGHHYEDLERTSQRGECMRVKMTPRQRKAVSRRMKKMWAEKRAEKKSILASSSSNGASQQNHIQHQPITLPQHPHPVILLAQLDELRVRAHQRVKEIEETLETLQIERQALLKAFPSFGISTPTGAFPLGIPTPGITEEEL